VPATARKFSPGGWIAHAFHASGLEVPRASVTVYSILMQSALLSSERFLSFLPASMLHFSAKRLSMKVFLTRRNAYSDVADRDYCA